MLIRAGAAVIGRKRVGLGLSLASPALRAKGVKVELSSIRPFTSRRKGVQLNVAAAAADVATDVTADLAVQTPAWRASIDFKYIRDHAKEVQANCDARAAVADVNKVVETYDKYLGLLRETDELRQERNQTAAKMKQKLEPNQRATLIEEGKALKVKVAALEADLNQMEAILQTEGQKIPNFTHPDVPTGGEENATLRKLVGSPREFEFPVKDHLELGEALKILDFETASAVSGTKFYYLAGAGALLEIALVAWAMAKVSSRGFLPHTTPDLVRASVLEKCGFQPRMANTQVYSVQDMDLCLTGTAEIPLGGLYADKVVAEEDLPIRLAAFGHCFRTEAGAAGAASKGLYRVHQFSKVEMFVLATAEQSDQIHEELISLEEEMFQDLGLHFKTLDMPSEDLGAPAYRKFDVECWMPGMQRYGEISSASNCTEFQSRRLNIRYRPSAGSEASEDNGGKKGGKAPLKFVHTLNATACAVPRMIIAILENFQQEDGTVVVPEVLRPYLGGMEVISPRQEA